MFEIAKQMLIVGWSVIGCRSILQLVFSLEYASQLPITEMIAKAPSVIKTNQSMTFKATPHFKI